jgi:hypothetical protein
MSAGVSLSVAEPAISAVPVDNPPIAGAAGQPRSEILEAWQPADAAPQTPRPFSPPSIDTPHHTGRQNVPDVLLNPVAPADTPAAPIENIPSAVSFGWSSKGTITVVSGTQNWPVFPFHGGERDHANRLEACRVLATDTARSLQSGRWNARSEYAEILDQYIAWLPKLPGEGNFLLADAKARIIREMFAAEQDFLPHPFTAELKVLLEQHIGLRAYYPAMEDFYESVRSGHLERPLPIDAAEGFIQGVRDNTPILFEPNVADTLQGVAQPLPRISKYESGGTNIPPHPVPPPDPLDPIDPEKSQRFTLASGINALWKVFLLGDSVSKAVDGWSKAKATLGPLAAQLIEYLRSSLPGGGN